MATYKKPVAMMTQSELVEVVMSNNEQLLEVKPAAYRSYLRADALLRAPRSKLLRIVEIQQSVLKKSSRLKVLSGAEVKSA